METLMEQAEIRERIRSFERWHYQFDLDGNLTPIWNQGHINRHQQRVSYFFDALLSVTGGTLAGKRVLDLGCNAGFWSLQAINAGADYVFGIDGRQMHIDQANFVFDVLGVDRDRYDFGVGDACNDDHAAHGRFDVVLCLGLLYHVSKPVELIERIAAANSDLLVIDTQVSWLPGSRFDVHHEDLDEPRNAIDHEMVMLPTRQAVVDLASFEGMRDYARGERMAFICSKQTSLSTLSAASPKPPLTAAQRMVESGLRRGRSAALSLRRR
jgi:SAM-dependent methyltransferase